MQTLTNLKKCLFGGALVAAGLATHEAHAQEFDFIDSSVSVHAYPYVYMYSGPGFWSLYAAYFNDTFGGAYASARGRPTLIENYSAAYGGLLAEASVDSRFTVTSNTFATLSYNDASLSFIDLTTGTTLLSVNNTEGSRVFELLVEHEYQYISTAMTTVNNHQYASLTIPAPASTMAFGLCGLLASRRRRI